MAPTPDWVLYDGLCGLCDRAVVFLLTRDRTGRLQFGALQGDTAAKLRQRHPDLPPADETFVLVERPGSADERIRVRSDAALAALARLGGIYRLATAFRVIPRPLRDALYGAVARRRSRWFGRLDACRLPTPTERTRFLD
jgi:predicted DCC family thiol-disulfide oxidoreductase YuxK